MVEGPVLHDAVTLRHFAVAGALDIVGELHGKLPGPYWTEAVSHEIWEAATGGAAECPAVLEASWLATPASPPDVAAALAIQRLCIALGGTQAFHHAGEAECLYFAELWNGAVA